MSERLPLFPLGLVLFPGLVLPLHVFEDRYRDLVRDLLALPGPEQRFGVVAIRSGHEVGADAVSGLDALHAVGCVARLRRAEAYPDGRYDLVTVGAERFRLQGLSTERSYLTGTVDLLPDDLGDADEAAVLARAVGAAFGDYLEALEEAGVEQAEVGDLPADPLVLGYLVAATAVVDLDQRQRLLAEEDGRARLKAELALLRREAQLLRTLRAVPDPGLSREPTSPN